MANTKLKTLWARVRRRAAGALRAIRRQRPVHFLHIGKTGGTAVRHALRQYPATRRFLIRLHPHEVKLRDVPVGEKVIFFLRDPVTRFTSAFYSRQRQGQPRYLSPWSPAEQEAFTHYTTPNQLALALSADNPAERARAGQAMRGISLVKDSYWTWFEDDAYFASRRKDILFVGFQESLNEDFESLKSLLGLPPDITLPADDVQAHRNPAHLDRKLDDRAVQNLKEWYRDDYRFVRTCEELSAGRNARGRG